MVNAVICRDSDELIRLFLVSDMSSHSILLLVSLTKKIIKQYELRERVCYEVMEDSRT